MSVLIVPPGPVDPATVRELSAGSRLSFGRGAAGWPVDLQIDHPGVSRVAGEILAAPTYWFLTNNSTRSVYLVENTENTGEFIRVNPGRAGLPIPFEISTVMLATGRETVSFQVYAPEQPCCASGGPDHLPGAQTASPFTIDRHAKYFLVLVALCEPRLRDGALAGLPNVGQIAERLRPLPGCEELTSRAVDFHIDYLARVKFRLRVGDGFAARREALATFAMRFGPVHPEDLALLPPVPSRLTGRAGQ
jgi:hypothetical protein